MISGMDLRNGKSINNFKGMFPIRPTSPPTTFIGATSFAPPFIQLQCLLRESCAILLALNQQECHLQMCQHVNRMEQ